MTIVVFVIFDSVNPDARQRFALLVQEAQELSADKVC